LRSALQWISLKVLLFIVPRSHEKYSTEVQYVGMKKELPQAILDGVEKLLINGNHRPRFEPNV